MNEIILENKNEVLFGKGKFDDYCVYFRNKIGKRALSDVEYFKFFLWMSKKYKENNVYEDFVSIYNKTTKEISLDVVNEIKAISLKYKEEKDEMEKNLSIIYMGMIAEENKANTKLGKRIKRLGMYNLLIEGMSPIEAANISKGKDWKTLDKLCSDRGF